MGIFNDLRIIFKVTHPDIDFNLLVVIWKDRLMNIPKSYLDILNLQLNIDNINDSIDIIYD